MKHRTRFVRAALSAALLCAALSASGAPTNVPCVETEAQARYRGFGYDHVVVVHNLCDRSELCTVSTDVNPEPERVTVEPTKVVEVLTFRGSPARTFTASVTCKP